MPSFVKSFFFPVNFLTLSTNVYFLPLGEKIWHWALSFCVPSSGWISCQIFFPFPSKRKLLKSVEGRFYIAPESDLGEEEVHSRLEAEEILRRTQSQCHFLPHVLCSLFQCHWLYQARCLTEASSLFSTVKGIMGQSRDWPYVTNVPNPACCLFFFLNKVLLEHDYIHLFTCYYLWLHACYMGRGK